MSMLKFFDGGYCTHPEFVAIKGGSLKKVKFPALCVLIKHPKHGNILFDTGYSENFFKATKSFPELLYAQVTPVYVKDEDKVVNKVPKIDHVIISHFHADHIGALKDFTDAKFHYRLHGFQYLRDKSRFMQVKSGFLTNLLPDDFKDRSFDITNEINDHFLNDFFELVFDIFGDGSLIAVELPGHARGQIGVYSESDKTFLIADACYLSQTFKNLDFPSPMVGLINDNQSQYKDTIRRIHKLYKARPDIEIIPSHCGDAFKKYVSACFWDTDQLNTCQH